MPELTKGQRIWLHGLVLQYFPNVFMPHLVELFSKFTRFAINGPLMLPGHLQFLNDHGNAEIEFDVPAMFGDDLLLRLINRKYLADLQSEARLRTFDVLEFLIRKEFEARIRAEESHFLRYFSLVCPGRTYAEDAPDLFIKMIAKNIDEFDPINNCYKVKFADIILHKPKSINEAYQLFAHRLYSLRRFGIWKEAADPAYTSPPDYKTLMKHFFEHLGQMIPFYRNILQHDGYFSSKKPSDPEILNKERDKGILRVAFAEMVYNELETVPNQGDIRIPTVPDDLINNIQRQSNKQWLFKQNKKADLPSFNDSEETRIREIFKEILERLPSPFLSKKTEAVLESANAPKGKGDSHEKLWALYEELLCNPDNLNFLNMPAIQKILTKNVRRKLSSLYWKQYVSSMDAPLSFDSNGNEITLHSLQNESVLNDGCKLSVEEELIEKETVKETKETMEDILTYIKTQFTDASDDEFIKILMDDVKTYMNWKKSLQPADIARIQANELTYYAIRGPNNRYNLFRQYQILKKPPTAPCLTIEDFQEKIINVSHYIKAKING